MIRFPEPLLPDMENLLQNIKKREAKHGLKPHANAHETLGILTEEYDEFKDEVKSDDVLRQYEELCDIAVAALFGMASLGGRL